MLWFCIHAVFLVCACASSRAEVLIDSDGGVTNLVVGINPEISESDIESVLSDLKNLFRNATTVLHTATRGQTYFKEIVFAVPKRYRTVLPSDTEWRTASAPFRQPEVLLTNRGTKPYALQHRGCGQQGLRIQLPKLFLKGAGANKAKSFVREWAKYRYGIFEESGSINDEMYPACYTIPGSKSIKVTDCTNKEASYEIRKPPENPSSCVPVPMKGGNHHVISSLMNEIEFPEVSQFCDDKEYIHNRFTPSKHNNLCQRQSTWKIISKHSDFSKTRFSRVNENSVNFKYVIEPDIRLVLGVDTSGEMEKNDRWDMVFNSFSYFLLNNLPENSMVEVKDLKKQNNKPLVETINTPADAEKLLDAFPETGGEGTVCVHCAIGEALEDLKRSSVTSRAHIVIISAHDIADVDTMLSLESKLHESDVSMHVLYFNRKLKDPPLIQKLCQVSGGLFHYIPDDDNSLAVLYEAFRSIYESFSWMNKNHVLVNQKSFSNSTCKSCNIAFLSDKSMENFQVLLTGPKFSHGPPVVKDKTILSNGNQEFAPGHSSFSYKRKMSAYVFTMKNPKPGLWSLNFERKPDFDKPLVVIIRSSSTKHNSIAHMSSWVLHQDNSKAKNNPPVAFYSEVQEKSLPVNNIQLSASLYHPYSKNTININLFDLGDGDTDITKKDGIFSKYFTEDSNSGYYVVTMTAESYYDGNSIYSAADEPESAVAKPFQRVTTLGSFYLPPQNRTVFFPPRRISDLRVQLYNKRNIVAYELKWTSPGNNFDSGSVSEYQVRLFRSINDAEENFNTQYILNITDFNIHGQMLTRVTVSGSAQTAIIEPRNLNTGTYYFAMRTKNDRNMFSEVSNVVEIQYTAPVTTSDPVTDENGSTVYPTSPGNDPEDQPISMSSGLGLALGLTLGILLFCIILGCLIYFYFKRYRKNEKDPHKSHTTSPDHKYLNDMSQKSESRDVLCQSTNALNVSVISPVNSWPADSLISHYESIKKDKNSESSMDLSIPKDSSDTISVSSSKYSNANQVNHDYPVYDAVCFNTLKRDDSMNYPCNPGYAPFNPAYTSSLRKDNNFNHGYSPNCSILDVSSLNGQGAINPVYMASLPRPRAFDRLLGDQSFSNMSHSSYSLNSQGKRRLGTDV